MIALEAILWFAALIISIVSVLVTVGNLDLIAMFPEGWRWWQMPLRVISLAAFALVVLCHPFKG